jgi:tetrapyrrole methylase family protein/MazG family protein
VGCIPQITIAGLGPGYFGHIPLSVWEVLKNSKRIFLRTERHPVVPRLKEEGISFRSFDSYYDESRDFAEVYRKIAAAVLREAADAPLVYAVPGNPLVAEETVELITREAKKSGYEVEILPAMSFLDALYVALGLNPAAGLAIIDGLRLGEQKPNLRVGNVIIQVYSRLVASDVKLFLMDYYPEDFPVTVVRAAGVPGWQRLEEHPLYGLDRLSWIDHLTTLYLPPCPQRIRECVYPLDPLVDIMAGLRGANGCPWDKEQTHLSLRKYLLEEAYEVLEAIGQGNMNKICEELGDLLLQIVFHAQIARENGFFDINDVVGGITEKMIRRHPHVFGGAPVAHSSEVEANWEKIKQKEKMVGSRPSLLEGVPVSLPALLKAQRVQARVSKVGFDWPDYQGAQQKVHEELRELAEAAAAREADRLAEEVGDLLFAVVNLARLLRVDAEMALAATVEKFTRRFRYVEEKAAKLGRELSGCTLQEMDTWWEEAKKVEEAKKK